MNTKSLLGSALLLLLASVLSVQAGTLRQRRDVSHLPLEYLPPVVLPPLPSREYLPPVEQHAASLSHVLEPPRDYLPPVAEQLKLNNEYLPPAPEQEQQHLEEAEATTTTEAAAPATTTTTTTTEEIITTTEAVQPTTTEEQLPAETEAPVEVKTHEDIEQLSAVLEDDGYHYRTPEIIPDLSPVALPALPAVDAYLPPLNDNAVVAEVAPQSDESAALLDDGYHYRAIRRLRH
ncbi:hypothetical protein KR222_008566 [Zaprionus bogoriensis]|nr:hypothetical protein KR222_008566 [Zaprionus bogoriensis]